MEKQDSKKRGMKILSLLLVASIFLSTQGFTVFAGSISGNEGTKNPEQKSMEKHTEDEESRMEEIVLDGSISINRTGAADTPANPVHYCTKKDDGTDYTKFSYIYFGSYPQSEVKSKDTIASIDKTIEKYGIKADAGVDVWVKGIKYRRISVDDTNDDGLNFNETAAINGYRYFEWKRIKWRVLKNDGRTLFIVADKAIDCKDYNEEDENVTWESSTLRDWLNNSFYNTAFSSHEQRAIVEQKVVNEDNQQEGGKGGNDTRDKIYLLSLSEVRNETYGFCSSGETYSKSRRVEVSDYSLERGARKSVFNWWLRSPGSVNSMASCVTYEGSVSLYGHDVNLSSVGVCPALHINLSSDAYLEKDDSSSGAGGDEKTANPSASIPSGSSIVKNAKLSLNSATVGADIYYTTNGTVPTVESRLYTEEIPIYGDMAINAVAMCKGYKISDVVKFTYELQESDNGDENDDGDNTDKEEGIPANPAHRGWFQAGKHYVDYSYVYFGSYPQSEVTDSAVISAIEKVIEEYGTEADAGMDVWVNGTKYRRIRKEDTNYDMYFDDMPSSNGYRYFKWERIKWRVLQNDGKTLLVMADKAMDCKNYNEICENITWEKSTIRKWLNDCFYNTAFCSNEQEAIVIQNIVNEDYGTEAGNDTNDNIYLLSYSEVKDSRYGFCHNLNGVRETGCWGRSMKASDYANARGAQVYNLGESCCWLRSISDESYLAFYTNESGTVYWDAKVSSKYIGVSPVLHINLSSDVWYMAPDGTSGEGGDEKVANPSASIPTESRVSKNELLSLSCATEGADIYYTMDGTEPTMESPLYTGEIVIDRDMTIKAVAMCWNYKGSEVSEFSYKVYDNGDQEEKNEDDGEKDDGKKDGSDQEHNNKDSFITIQKLTIKSPSKKLASGKKVKLTLSIIPEKATNKAVKWETSNKKYATVDKNGKITLKKKGIGKKVTITATAQDGSGKKASIKVQIMRHAVKSIKLTAPKKTLKAGKTMTIKAAVKTTGKNANKTLTWKSSNNKYATVSKNGRITAKKAGKGKTVVITAASTDGSNKKAKIKIKIY